MYGGVRGRGLAVPSHSIHGFAEYVVNLRSNYLVFAAREQQLRLASTEYDLKILERNRLGLYCLLHGYMHLRKHKY